MEEEEDSYPMPTLALINGHAFAGGLILALFHDYRMQHPTRGFLCLNELDSGLPLLPPMASIFREKLPPTTSRSLVLEARRFAGPEALRAGIVDALGEGVDGAVGFVRARGLCGKARTGVYGEMKEGMYRETVGLLRDREENDAWVERIQARRRRKGRRDAMAEEEKNVKEGEGRGETVKGKL